MASADTGSATFAGGNHNCRPIDDDLAVFTGTAVTAAAAAAADAGRIGPAGGCDLAAGNVDLLIRSGAGTIAADACGAGPAGGLHGAAEDGDAAADIG